MQEPTKARRKAGGSSGNDVSIFPVSTKDFIALKHVYSRGAYLRHPCRFLLATLLTSLVMTAPIHALEIRGAVFNVLMPEVLWTPQNFAGFYYDLDHDLGYESLTLKSTDATPSGATISGEQDATGSYGIVYEANRRQVSTLSNAKIGTTYGS
jgi:hypothetical protein